jgi:hypothetical protein
MLLSWQKHLIHFTLNIQVMNAESDEKKQLRLKLSEMTANVIASAMGLLGDQSAGEDVIQSTVHSQSVNGFS